MCSLFAPVGHLRIEKGAEAKMRPVNVFGIDTGPGRGEGATWVNFCWVCAAGLSEPLPHYSLFCGLIIDPILVTLGQIRNFHNPNLFTFCLCIYLILNEEHFPFHLQYKRSGTFCKYR